MTNKYSTEEIRKLYVLAARVVTLYGDIYLPIFERMHKEIQLIDQSQTIKSIALTVASANVKTEELAHRMAHKPSKKSVEDR